VDSSLVGYDGCQSLKDEEQHMTPETEPSPAVTVERSTKIRRWTVALAAVVMTGSVLGVVIYGHWTKSRWIGVADKTFWDYLQLLIVPAALALGVAWLSGEQKRREQAGAAVQRQRDREFWEKLLEREREREQATRNQQWQEEVLQAYLDQMSQLMVDDYSGTAWRDEARKLARARTLTVLQNLSNGRLKSSVLRFLYESGLLKKDSAVVDLTAADLRGADLRGVRLNSASLRGVDLREANLAFATLQSADLESAYLREANLSAIDLLEANVVAADLLEVDLRGANLRGIKGITNEELEQQARSLQGATMPNGQRYEDWLKDREKRQQDE
jgi:uncharacterized protein YjbI with pentapeptide repeats